MKLSLELFPFLPFSEYSSVPFSPPPAFDGELGIADDAGSSTSAAGSGDSGDNHNARPVGVIQKNIVPL